jgi:hypothetical protein
LHIHVSIRKSMLIIAVILPLAAAGGIYMVIRLRHTPASTPPSISSQALVARLQECADLVTVRAPVTSVIEQADSGRLGSAHALLSVTCWLDVGCDLHRAQVLSASPSSHLLCLSLPAPRILAIRIDPDRTKVHTLSRTWLWHLYPGSEIELNLINKAVNAAAGGAIDQATSDSLITLARSRISAELKALASGSGWEIEVSWQP